jgi:hypothetical protein
MATMARSTRDTLIFATILLAPMAAATAYIAFTPTPEPIVIREVVTEQVVVEVAAPPVAEVAEVAEVVEPEPPTEPVHQPEGMRPAGAGMLVYEGQVVLTTKPDVAWARGKLRSPEVDYGVVATRSADPARLPEDLRALADARLVLYRADGGTCTAGTGPDLLKIYGRQDGELFYPEAEDGQPTAAELLAARKEVFAEAQLLLARLRPATGGPRCDGLWARRADLPAPAVFAPNTDDDDALRAQVLAQIAGQPAVIALAARYEAHRAELTGLDADIQPWSTFMTDTVQVSRWDEVGGARSYVNVIVGDGGESCSDLFPDQTTVLFAREGGELVAQADSGFLAPLALMDLERDGHLEAVTEGGNRIESSGPAGDVQQFTIPYHGCPC